MKPLLISTSAVILLLGCIALIYAYPRQVTFTSKAVEYRLGAGQQELNTVTVQVNGKFSRGLWWRTSFKGTIRIEGASNPNPNNQRPLDVEFDEIGKGVMGYGYSENGRPFTAAYGVLLVNNDFSKFTIEEFEPEGTGEGWNGGNGLMISGPATHITQAISISNELMK